MNFEWRIKPIHETKKVYFSGKKEEERSVHAEQDKEHNMKIKEKKSHLWVTASALYSLMKSGQMTEWSLAHMKKR